MWLRFVRANCFAGLSPERKRLTTKEVQTFFSANVAYYFTLVGLLCQVLVAVNLVREPRFQN
jgi:hypothetical protein